MKKLYILLAMTFVLQLAARAEAISLELSCNVSGLTCDNSGVYTLTGVDFVNVAGVEIVIQYDNATLQSPAVTNGVLFGPNDLKKGKATIIKPDFTENTIKIASATILPGNGMLAKIKFTVPGSVPGNVSIQSSNIVDQYGVKLPHSRKNPSDFISEKATMEDEEKRLAAEKAAKDAEEKRLAAEKAAKDAEEKRLAAEAKDAADAEAAAKAAKDAEDARIAAAKAAKDAEDARIAKAEADERARAAAALAAQAQANASGASVTVVGGASIGTITLPPDQMASTDRKTEYQPLVTDLRGDMTIPVSGGGTTAQAAGDQQPAKDKTKPENKSVSYKSVLQLFREFKGEKSAKSLISLFADGAVPNFSQNPPVALSDGTTPVRLTLTLKQGGNDTPKFILQGASVQQISSEGEEQTAWIIDALPRKGVYDAKLTVIDGQITMEFPLVVAPPVGPLVQKAQKFTEADFALYLSKPAEFDLNKDSKFDSLDDYIFTANYIAALKIKPEKLKKDEPKPAVQGEAKGKEAQKPKEEKTKKVPTP